MKVVYLGTAAAEGIPALFCNCETCRRARAAGEFRSRAQVVIDSDLSVDFPPDNLYHAAKFPVDFSALKYVLVTHSHVDHFYAGDFVLRGYKYALGMKEPRLTLFGNRETLSVFLEGTRREMRPEISEQIGLVELRPFERVRFGEYEVHPLAAAHSSEQPLLFLIEKGGKRILHLHDTALLPEEDYRYLERLGGRVDLVTLDCTFLDRRAGEGARHMGLYECAEVLGRLEQIGLLDGATKKVITHFSHTSAPTRERLARAEEQFGVIAAYDGMELVL